MENMNRLITLTKTIQAYPGTFTKRGEERIQGNILQIFINHKYGSNKLEEWPENKNILLVLLSLFNIGEEFWKSFNLLNEQMENQTFKPLK